MARGGWGGGWRSQFEVAEQDVTEDARHVEEEAVAGLREDEHVADQHTACGQRYQGRRSDDGGSDRAALRVGVEPD